MKLSCDREKLLETFQIAESITPRKTSKPILKNIKLDAFESKSRVTATNIELTMIRTIDVGSVGEEGSVLVSGKDMADILREANAGDVFITVEENSVVVKSAEDTFTIQSNIAEEFFSVEDIKPAFEIKLDKNRLSQMIHQTIFTAGKETMAYTFEGILFNVEKDRIELVGTDGKRIAIASAECNNDAENENRSLVPISTLRILQNLIGVSTDEQITIKFSSNHIVFQDSTTELISQLIEGRFPEYRNYIPSEYNIISTFQKDDLSAGIRKADIMTSQETHLIRFKFGKPGQMLNLTSRCLDRGASEINVPMDTFEGEGITVGYNGRHILDVLKVLRDDTVTWKIKEEQGPGEIAEGNDFKYVFMPVKLK